MNIFRFEGTAVLLGLFGQVKPGDVLVMTSKEAAGVKGDRRFKSLKAVPKDCFAELEKIDETEEARREVLTTVNQQVAQREEDQLTREEIREMARKVGVQAAGWLNRKTILARIRAAETRKN
jgi:hypothetical protein